MLIFSYIIVKQNYPKMKIITWIVQGLLSLAFLGASISKLITPYDQLASTPNMAWVNDFSALQIQLIASVELLAVLGLTLPLLLKKFYFVVPISAIFLALVMVGAIATHIQRGEAILVNIILLTLSIATLWFQKHLLSSKPLV